MFRVFMVALIAIIALGNNKADKSMPSADAVKAMAKPKTECGGWK